MRNRHRGFTLIELLVVIGILLLLAGILLPVFSKAHRQSQILTQKLDFQAIAQALENYKHDFGDYPRNTSLPTWNGTGPAPAILCLATALIGPGPAVYNSTTYQAGDGADGFGFRTQIRNISTTNVPDYVAVGKIWGPYLQTDKFTISWTTIGGQTYQQPQLLDRFGTPIQYFTRFGPNTNRTANSFSGYNPSVLDGPLYGYSAPNAVNLSHGQDAIYDQNEATPFFGTNQAMAFQWMLGDDNVNDSIDNSETLRFTGSYVLISAGPDATFCDLSTISSSPVPPALQPQLSQAFTASGNVYNFDR